MKNIKTNKERKRGKGALFASQREKAPLLLLFVPLLAAVAAEPPFMLFLGASAVLLHEGGHLLCFHLCHSAHPHLRLAPFGLRLYTASLLSPAKEAFVCLGGPLANLLAAGLLFFASSFALGDFLRLYGAVHLLAALFNLLPFCETDGGRLFSLFLRGILPKEKAERVGRFFSVFFLSFFFFFSCFLFYFGGIGLYGVFFSIFFFWEYVCDDFEKKRDFESF
ncbi:MAG: hypothetical protein J6K61_00465 [Clostridia bacterium]|nr:hypothetical protein [Clostridia bacterium]